MPFLDQELPRVEDTAGRPIAIPTLSAFFYCAVPVHQLAAGAAMAIERYLDYCGRDVLTLHVAMSGYWKPLTPRVLARDLAQLRRFPADHVGANIEYDSGGAPGPFGVLLSATDLVETIDEQRANLLRLDWPSDWLDTQPVDALLAFVTSVIEALPVQSANVGFAFKRTGGTKTVSRRGVHQLLRRYFGFDPCWSSVSNRMLGCAFGAHWLNYVDATLASGLGGEEAIAAALPDCPVSTPTGGVLVQGARRPPVGDVERGATDLGCLPSVARVLKPVRPPIKAFGDTVFDAASWLARLDELPSRNWDNTGAV
jgi:hypothetical protein